MHTVHVIDSHTGGEPTRVVVSGLPDLGPGPLTAQRDRFRAEFDHWRRAVACEPRGSDTVVGALLLPPQSAQACAATIFFNNVGTLGMCGHGTIGLVRTLQYLGRIQPGQHYIDTPVGTVGARLHEDGRVSIDNVESWRHAAGVRLEVPGYGEVSGDVAWGGNWFFIVRTERAIGLQHEPELRAYAEAIRRALVAHGVTGADGAEIDHIELETASPTPGLDGRNYVLCPGLAYDRSPCGTGTSAKLACLAADGKLAPDQTWRQESVIGSVFEGRYRAGERGVLPTITGSAYVTARAQLLIDPNDAFAWGVVAR
ncbi:proline racemase family protein [Lysobacter sp. BMK333-48F3]|uniref:proline racemase family protein n=1 Tax=Lysobacter sp. BMK333-48F3 TaxID=2867962 RepID=UPI001C8CE9BB|nr:proline racemase family protein [Lysobacter sp. BMK333-48F3]MBX9400463.1 proline racemase family protein [Lysobacter sp. BMK333-48F3]